MNTPIPPALTRWSTIWIVALSNPFKPSQQEELAWFRAYMDELGINTILWEHFYDTVVDNIVAWSAKNRADDFNGMVANPDIDAVRVFQWWKLVNQILKYVDFDQLKKNPKCIFGKSDIDTLHLAIYVKTWLRCFHMSDSKLWWGEFELAYTKKWWYKRCFEWSREIDGNSSFDVVAEWEAQWRLLWANLTVLTLLQWTPYQPDYADCILMIEAYSKDPRGLLRELEVLEMSGCFDSLKGVLIGTIAKREHSSRSHVEIIWEFFERYSIPVMSTEIFGHYQPHACIPIGAKARMSTNELTGTLLEDVVNV